MESHRRTFDTTLLENIKNAYQRTTWGNTVADTEDWQQILTGENEAQKRQLFQHLFLESPDGSDVRELFEPDEIRRYLTGLVRPFPRAHLERRRKVWRWLYCGVREPIPELDWRLPVISNEEQDDEHQ